MQFQDAEGKQVAATGKKRQICTLPIEKSRGGKWVCLKKIGEKPQNGHVKYGKLMIHPWI
jgi:hypothetical protein